MGLRGFIIIYIFHHNMWVKNILNFKIWKSLQCTSGKAFLPADTQIVSETSGTDLKYKMLWSLAQK